MDRLREYCPLVPSERQRIFLGLTEPEAFYGGAAGGGKSFALLMSGLEFVHIPGYRAIIFRRTSGELEDLISTSQEWLHGKAEWHGTKLRWTFPSGARLRMSHLQHEKDKYDHKGFAYQFIGWDELTSFSLTQYTYLFSRLRRPECTQHKANPQPDCPTCNYAAALANVPLRVRSGSNPDGPGRFWVRNRFVTKQAMDDIAADNYQPIYYNVVDGERIPFVPSRIEDNHGLDQESYIKTSLSKLSPVARQQLRKGDWKVSEDGQIPEEWLRYYISIGGYIVLLKKDGTHLCRFAEAECQMFGTADTAGTSEDKALEKRGKAPSWSVIAVWLKPPARYGKFLILWHVWRKRVGFPDLLKGFRGVNEKYRCKITVENKHVGPAVYQMLRNEQQMDVIDPGKKDKVDRAVDLLNMLERGEVFLPEANNDWRPEVEAEWLGWTGDKDEPNDLIDVAAYAAILQSSQSSSWGGVVNAR